MNIIEKLEKLHSDLVALIGNIDELQHLHAIIEEYKNAQEPIATAYECTSCNHWYIDFPVTHCDCMPEKNEFKEIKLFTHPPLSDETVKDAERYRWLCNNVSNSFILTKNDDHKTNYVTAKEWIEEYAPEHFSHDDLDEIQKMKDTDTIWRLQVYPDTPIGFYVWHGATLSYAIDEAMKADK